jgi:hypothetical protein
MQIVQLKQRNRMLADLANRLTEQQAQLKANLDVMRSAAEQSVPTEQWRTLQTQLRHCNTARRQAEAQATDARSHAELVASMLQQRSEQLRTANERLRHAVDATSVLNARVCALEADRSLAVRLHVSSLASCMLQLHRSQRQWCISCAAIR